MGFKGACQRKRRFTSSARAHRAASDEAVLNRASLRVYRCPDCNGWHLTSMKSSDYGKRLPSHGRLKRYPVVSRPGERLVRS